MITPINTPEEALERLKPGEWVLDASEQPWCLVNTHVMVEQIMWMAQGGRSFVEVGGIPFPIYEAEINPEGFSCEHSRVQECGHCQRCGQIVGDPEEWKNRQFGFGLPPGLSEAQRVALMDQIGAAVREHIVPAVPGGESNDG